MLLIDSCSLRVVKVLNVEKNLLYLVYRIYRVLYDKNLSNGCKKKCAKPLYCTYTNLQDAGGNGDGVGA